MSEETQAAEREFVAAVAAMRAAQKSYFNDRTQAGLVEAKRLEKEVDRWLGLYAAVTETPDVPDGVVGRHVIVCALRAIADQLDLHS